MLGCCCCFLASCACCLLVLCGLPKNGGLCSRRARGVTHADTGRDAQRQRSHLSIHFIPRGPSHQQRSALCALCIRSDWATGSSCWFAPADQHFSPQAGRLSQAGPLPPRLSSTPTKVSPIAPSARPAARREGREGKVLLPCSGARVTRARPGVSGDVLAAGWSGGNGLIVEIDSAAMTGAFDDGRGRPRGGVEMSRLFL